MTPQIATVGDRSEAPAPASRSRSAALIEAPQPTVAVIAMWVFVVIPFLALLVAVPGAWGGGLSYVDLPILAVGYVLAGLGVSHGVHRCASAAAPSADL